MASAIPQGRLAEIVRAAQARTSVPAVAAGLLVDGQVELTAAGPVEVETPFRIASISKWFTASLAAVSLHLDPSVRRLLSHTADLRPEAPVQLPEQCRGLWSYSNAGYWAVGEAIAAAAGMSFSDAMRERILEPLGLASTGFEEPAGAAQGHIQDSRTGPVEYPVARRPSGGLWSTVGDLLRFAEHQLGGPGPLAPPQLEALCEPQAEALGARYCLGCWRRELADGRLAFDHEGSAAGYQCLLLLVPEQRAALAVLTNSWLGSALIRDVVGELGFLPATLDGARAEAAPLAAGRYALDGSECVIEDAGDGRRVRESDVEPLTGVRIVWAPYRLEPLGGGVYGAAGGLLMSHRVDAPRPGVARVGWVALPRADS